MKTTLNNLRQVFVFIAILFSTIFPTIANARITSFGERHHGVVVGAGTYYHPLVNDNAFDPVPGLATTGTTVAGSKSVFLMPVKFGYFLDFGPATLEVYGLYQTSFKSAWTATGTSEGAGTSSYSGLGGGAQVTAFPFTRSMFRMGVAFNFEYYKQKARLKYLPTAGGTEILDLNTKSLLLGAGPQIEIWLGDMYVLSLFGGYQWGKPFAWASGGGEAFEQNYAAGALTAPSGSGIKSQFGGVLLQASLKLNFP